MFVKLSPKQRDPKLREEFGPLWINTEKICKMEQRIGWREVGSESGKERHVWYVVYFDGDVEQRLDERQFNELLSVLPTPQEGVKWGML